MARFAPDTPAELERIVAKALKKDPDERYQTSKDLLIDLRALKEDYDFKRRLERSSGDAQAPRDPTPAPGAAQATVTPAPSMPLSTPAPSAVPTRSRSSLVIGLVALIAVGAAAGGWFLWRGSKVRWAEAQVPKIQKLADSHRNFEAYDLAVLAERYLPADSTVSALMPRIADAISVTSDPAGASVYLKRFNPDATGEPRERQLIGQTPIESLRVPRGDFIVAIEKDGFAPAEFSVSGARTRLGALNIIPPPIKVHQRLLPATSMPPRMTFVPGGQYRLVGWERPTDRRVDLHDYFIDKFETTNRSSRSSSPAAAM